MTGKYPSILVLLPNQFMLQQRLARCISRTAGTTAECVPAPPFRVLSQWCLHLVQSTELLAGRGLPASPPAALVLGLWEATLAPDFDDRMQAEVRAAARVAADAERLLGQWHTGAVMPHGGGDWARFLQWREQVDQQRRQRGWCRQDWAMGRLVELLSGGAVSRKLLPQQLLLAGFIEVTALEGRLFEVLSGAGVEISREESDVPGQWAAPPSAYPDLAAELRAAAHWAAAQAAHGDRRVAVIVNELEALSGPVRRAFDNALHPDAVLGLAMPGTPRFCLSAMPPLAAHPLVDAALYLLELSVTGIRRPLEFHRVSRLLLEPAWAGHAGERFARALLEHCLRDRGESRLSLSRLMHLAGDARCPGLLETLTRLPAVDRNRDAASEFTRLLNHWGWPGSLVLDAVTRTSLQRFTHCLEQLDGQAGPERLLDLRELCALERQAQAGDALSPVQVIGPEQAVGNRYDAARLVNFTERNWPAPVHRNALLPAALRERIPRMNPQGRLEYTRALTAAMLACAPELECSFALSKDGVPQRASPLFPDFPEAPAAPVPTSLAGTAFPATRDLPGFREHPWLRARQAPRGLPVAQPFGALEHAVRTLQMQSACPFAAYFAHRLKARFAQPPEPFPGPAFSGGVIHAALECLYRPLMGSDRVAAPGQVAEAVDRALQQAGAERLLLPAALAVERLRIIDLLCNWLAEEALRPRGALLDLETELTGNLEGFDLRVRPDRLESAPQGGAVIFDYKTGRFRTPRWLEPRPGDLQLPLYAVLLASRSEGPPGGVVLQFIRDGELRNHGMVDHPARAAPGIRDFSTRHGPCATWEEVLDRWRRQLGALAREYRAGDASIVVHDTVELEHAGLEPLLRTAERTAWLAARGAGDD